ncbi:MAG TPA: STAS domain-containing protein [Terriglobales bacterium]|nr:STAS domain-containing protein [Terriglobales bacterium]
MEIDVRNQAQIRVIKLRGRLNLGEPVDRLRATVDELLKSGNTRLLVDLEEVPLIDSSGIGLLVNSLTSARKQGGSVKLLNPSKFAIQSLRLIGLLNQFEVFQDPQAALASFD